jgi:hypothetical protein
MTNSSQKRAGWQNAHDLAFQAMSVVLRSNVAKKPWPFVVAQAATGTATQAKRGGVTGGACAVPVGNHGDNLTTTTTRYV